MMQVYRTGYFGVNVGKWPVAQAREYFRTCNLKTSKAQEIINVALIDQKMVLLILPRSNPFFGNK